MRPKEVALYGAASQAEHIYMEEETRVMPIYFGLSAWRKADLKPDDASLNALENQRILMASYEAIMEQGASQTPGDIESALKAPQ
jgi:hypothetical protein